MRQNQTFLNFVLQANKDSAEDRMLVPHLSPSSSLLCQSTLGSRPISRRAPGQILSYCVFPGIKSKNRTLRLPRCWLRASSA